MEGLFRRYYERVVIFNVTGSAATGSQSGPEPMTDSVEPPFVDGGHRTGAYRSSTASVLFVSWSACVCVERVLVLYSFFCEANSRYGKSTVV